MYETTNLDLLPLASHQLVLGDLFKGFIFMENIGQIVRSKKTGKSRYTPINNEILQSSQLTCEEKTILIYLLSLPEDWVVYKTVIWQKMNIGRNRFNAHWKGLVDKGYIVSVRVIDTATNLVRGWNHIVYEEPVLTESRIDDSSDLPNLGLSENHSINKEHIPQSNNNTKETTVEISDEYIESFDLWLKYKKEKKQKYTKTGIQQLIKSSQQKYTPKQFTEVVEHSISQNYSGLYEPKQDHNKKVTEGPVLKVFKLSDYE